MFEGIQFFDKQWFWAFLLLPLAMLWYVIKYKQQTAELNISSIEGFKAVPSRISKLKHGLFMLRLLALALIITALARPRSVDMTSRVKTTRGIDIVMAIDVSASMLARDLLPNRLEALKQVATEFINDRPNDRIGLVEYAGEGYTRVPVTSDKALVLRSLKTLEDKNNVIRGGTAIGVGLATAVNRLKTSKAKSKVIILLTDGVNNTGFIDPKIASDLAVEYGIKTYTIGLGTNGTAISPVYIDPKTKRIRYARIPVKIDETLLKAIAKATGGKYFRATDNKKLEAIYKAIDKLEKTDIKEFKYYNYDEKYRILTLLAGLLLLLEFLLRSTVFKSFV